jgi:signal transduction histidine kinase
MAGRRRRVAFGLRGRIVGVVLVTTVATLAVAAGALLGPLESSLRSASLTTLQKAFHDKGATAQFTALDLSRVDLAYVPQLAKVEGSDYQAGHDERQALWDVEKTVAAQLGATTATLMGYFDATGHGAIFAPPLDADLSGSDRYEDVTSAYLARRPIYSFGTIDGAEYARVAVPITINGVRYVLAIRKPTDEVAAAVHTVRTAFIYAALAGLALTLILGIPLSGTLVRRLRRLRQTALRLAVEGPGVEVPVDRARDEVGDLARTFAIMQHRLQQQEEARRAFVATASHELRTPLTSLDGMLELLEDELREGEPDVDDARDLLERARAQSRRLGRLAADLLDLSRIDADVKLRSEPVELGELSRAVLAEFELGNAERRVSSALDDIDGQVWALADPGSVARILRILLENALRASPEGSEVKVDLHDGSLVALSVSDAGPGVPPEEREIIFERFQRGRDTAGKAGFGLGLAIGRELAERMGGELVLDLAYSPGARFTLRLPAARAPDEGPVPVA